MNGFKLKRFLDISKVFDKEVQFDGIISKRTQIGISWNLLNLLRVFIKGRKQREVPIGSNFGSYFL